MNHFLRPDSFIKYRFIILLSFFFTYTGLYAQQGVIRGVVKNARNNEPVPFANIVIQGTTIGQSTDFDGLFNLGGLSPGLYNLTVTSIGFEPANVYEIAVSNNKDAVQEILLKESVTELEEVRIKASPFSKSDESPVSLRTIGVNEIRRNPGGNRDISRVIQSLPGVSTTASFRNDVIIRGGAPNENRFYLDDVEVPNINHFATQGSSGGPVGLINVDFLREVDLYTGAFPAARGNALSSVFNFKQREGRDDRWGLSFTIGSSDVGLMTEGPVGEKSTVILSARRSYLQLLFQALQLPFLPTYNDFQFKWKTKFNTKNELTVLGLGAIDDFQLNLENDETEDARYLLATIPVNTQWNYTIGSVFKHYYKNGSHTLVASRTMLNNEAIKYKDNDESTEENLLLNYISREMENKFRYENKFLFGRFQLNSGISYEYARYENNTFNRINEGTQLVDVSIMSELDMHKWGFFGSLSSDFLENRLTLSLGIRMDANNYSSSMSRLYEQFSPRFSASYTFLPNWSLNFNVGRYYQLPAYTTLGYRDSEGVLANKENGLKYIRCDHLVGGIEWNTNTNSRITIEGFYKKYNNYPFSLRDSISLANLGADFGVIGNEEVVPISEGRSYGIELMFQQKLQKGYYGIVAFTYVWSEFRDKNNQYVPSSWDNREIISVTAGKKFKKNWELGLKWRYSGGLPFTPYDLEISSLIDVFDIRQMGVPDYDQLNQARLRADHSLDFRVDKTFYFDKWSFELYLDIENAYNNIVQLRPNLTVDRDDSGNPLTDPADDSRYVLKELENANGSLIPTLGVVVQF